MANKRSDKAVIVMTLGLTYAVCISVFAVIRLLNQEWGVAILDLLLASIGLLVFSHVWISGNAEKYAYVIAVISIIGTIATLVLKGSGQIYWAYPSVAMVFYLLPNKQALFLWAIAALTVLFILRDLPAIQLITIGMTLFTTGFFCYLFSAKMASQHARLVHIAYEDALTQVFNRRAFNRDTNELATSNDTESAIIFDLDKFKQVNDFFGHGIGDDVLKSASQFVKSIIGKECQMYRIGGDEFALLCTGKDFNYTYQLANKIHTEFNQSAVNKEHHITLSMAVAQKHTDESIKEWLGRLDSALYQAKKSGRNQVVKAIRY